MNFATIPDYIRRATPMTAGELKKKIRNIPNDVPVYMVVDKVSDDAWDEDKNQWRYVLPLVYVTKETSYGEDEDEHNLLLEYESL